MGSVKQVLVAALAAMVLLTVSVSTTGATTVAAAAKPLTLGAPAEGGVASAVDASLPIEASVEEEEGADETAADMDVTSRGSRRPHRPRHPHHRRCKKIKICKIRIVYRHRPCRGRRYSHRLAVQDADADAAEEGDAEEDAEGQATAAEGDMDTTTRDRRRGGYPRYRCRRVRCFIKFKCRRGRHPRYD
ncbi:hypothetical protein MMPV_005773 [Pyropia vietnamensis]